MGSQQVINCTVSIIREMESSSVMFSWRRPGGGSVTSDSRVTISLTTSSDNISHTSSLQFTYLMEGDKGNYTCNVTVLDATGSQSILIESLTST